MRRSCGDSIHRKTNMLVLPAKNIVIFFYGQRLIDG